ncbi:MAG: DNA repair protein RecO [Chlorobi bacterium]|nr:DNA repair protein RecO [Chlorobiota bacterium]
MLVKTKGVVLYTLKYGDSSLILHLYTEKYGRLSVMVKGVSGKKTGTLPAYFQPLNILETDLYYIPGRNFQKIKEVRFHYPYHSIPFNIRKSTIALFLSEVLRQTLSEEVNNPPLFSWLFASLRILDQMEENFTDFHLAFLIRLCRYLGFHPHNNYSLQNRIFDLREGIFTATLPLHPDILNEPLTALFNAYLRTPLGEKIIIPKNKERTDKLLEVVLDYYYIHMEGMGKIKSLTVLKDVFKD